MAAVSSLRSQPGGPSSSKPSNDGLGWWGVLPPVGNRQAHESWWLPLSDRALVQLSGTVLQSSGDWDSVNPSLVAEVIASLESDPPLFFFTVLSWPGEEFVTLHELAEWLIGAAPDFLSGGEWILSAPEILASHERHWSRLMARCRMAPPSEWMAFAAEWLQVLGPDVPESWSTNWPEVLWQNGVERHPGPAASEVKGSKLLQKLARARKRELVTEHALSALAENRKLAAAKQLAYGLSHEINNPLANISARAQALSRDESDAQRLQSLGQIVQQVYRAHEMIAGLMFYANPPEPEMSETDLNELLERAEADFTEQASDRDIRLIVEKLRHPAMANVDADMMLEAVRVLLRNSVEAVGGGGTIVLSLEDAIDSVSGGPVIDRDRKDARWLIHVADSGPGLDSEAAAHAFDPFYSGREAGRGLGLGLCRAHRVAKLHNATIRLSGGLAGCVATIAVDSAS